MDELHFIPFFQRREWKRGREGGAFVGKRRNFLISAVQRGERQTAKRFHMSREEAGLRGRSCSQLDKTTQQHNTSHGTFFPPVSRWQEVWPTFTRRSKGCREKQIENGEVDGKKWDTHSPPDRRPLIPHLLTRSPGRPARLYIPSPPSLTCATSNGPDLQPTAAAAANKK